MGDWFVALGVVAARDFSEFYRLEFGRVVGSVRPVAGAAAEDVAQEAFIVAHAVWAEVGVLDIPFAWVRRVACGSPLDVPNGTGCGPRSRRA